MEKAYDLKELGKRMQSAGLLSKDMALEALEMAAGEAYVVLKGWAKESAVLSENKLDDYVAPFYDNLDPLVLPQIDKINPKG